MSGMGRSLPWTPPWHPRLPAQAHHAVGEALSTEQPSTTSAGPRNARTQNSPTPGTAAPCSLPSKSHAAVEFIRPSGGPRPEAHSAMPAQPSPRASSSTNTVPHIPAGVDVAIRTMDFFFLASCFMQCLSTKTYHEERGLCAFAYVHQC